MLAFASLVPCSLEGVVRDVKLKKWSLSLVGASVLAGLLGAPLVATSGSKSAPKLANLEKPNWKKISPRKTTLEGFSPQIGHSRRVSSISFSADGKLMATASGFDDGMLKVWNLEKRQLIRTLDGEDYAAVSPDGKFVASGNVGGPIRVWAVDGWKMVEEIKGSGPITFSVDGKYLVGEALPDKMGGEGRLMRWEVDGWKPTNAIEGHEASFTTMTRAAGGQFIATGSYDQSIKVWDIKSGSIVRTFKQGNVKEPSALALSPDSEKLAVSYRDGDPIIQIWDVSSSKIEKTIKLTKFATELAYTNDGKKLAAAALDGKTHIFDPASGKETASFDSGGHVAIAPTTNEIVHGEAALTVRDAAGKQLHVFEANTSLVFQTVFSADGKKLVTTDATSGVDIWDVKSGKLTKTTPIENGTEEEPIGELILSPSGTYVARRPFVGTEVVIWKTDSGEVAYTLDFSDLGALRGVTFAPNEKELVIESPSDDDGTQVVWWSLEKNARLNGTKISGYVSVDGFIDDGKNVALVSTGTNTGKARLALKLWDRETGLMQSVKVEGIAPFAGDIDFAGHGQLIALGDTDNTIKLWSREQNKVIGTLSKHEDLVNLVSFSPDGRLLATGSWDETVRIWDVKKGTAGMIIEGGLYQAQNAAFSPKDDVMAISHKGWLRVVHLPTGRSRILYRVGDGWLGSDTAGHFDCAGQGCDLAMYHTAEGEFITASDKRLAKLKGLEGFGK